MPQIALQKPQEPSGSGKVRQAGGPAKDLPQGLPEALAALSAYPVRYVARAPGQEEFRGDGVDVSNPDVVVTEPPEVLPPPPRRATWEQRAAGVRRPHAEAALSYGWSREKLVELHRLAQTIGVYTMEVGPQAVYLGTDSAGAWLAAYHDSDLRGVWAAIMYGQSTFVAYTDGSGTRKGQPSGLGVVLVRTLPNDVDPTGKTTRDEISYISENCGLGTNNHAELSAVWRALTLVSDLRRPLTIRADSLYAIGCSTNPVWKIKANHELIEKIRDDLSRRHDVRFEHVRGHSGDPYNEAADKLANQGRKDPLGTVRLNPAM